KKGYRGQGVRLALIDTDFRGWEKLKDEGKLPPKTRLVDLTAENSNDFRPLPDTSAAAGIGHGTHCALAAALAAPDAELVLIRIAGIEPRLLEPRLGFHDPYQIDEIIRYFRGGTLSPQMD